MAGKPTYEELEKKIRELEKTESDHKRAEERMRVSEEKFRVLFEKSLHGILIVDIETRRFPYANPAFCRMFGYSETEMLQIGVEDIHPKDSLGYILSEFSRQKHGEKAGATELPCIHKDGTVFNADIAATNIIINHRKCVVGFFIDITERKRAEKELFFKENIIKSSSCAIATFDLKGNMTYGNPFFQKLWGFDSPREYLGKSVRNFWRLGDQDEHIMRLLQSEATWAGGLKGIRKDGGLFYVQFSAATILDDTGNPIALTSTSIDITEQKATEVQFQKLQKVESLSRMAGAVAHHFNNQLSVIMSNLELFLLDLPNDAKNRKNLLQSMMAAHKAAATSRQMLSYLGHAPGPHEPIDLSEACRQILSLLREAIPKGMILNVDFPDFGPIIRVDEGQINQILTHLITNAWESILKDQGNIGLTIRTVAPGEIPTTQSIPVDWTPQSVPHACLEVSDTGCGITSMDIEKLFDPFFTTKFIGRGMGLSVVRGIVKAHGGSITVDSEPGCGSVFRIYLPISTEKITHQYEKTAAPTRKVENTGTVLLIEDEERVRDDAKAMLIHLGYAVIDAQDGVEALQIFKQRQNEICCVLSDLTMPRMNGWETLTELRRMRADIPVILVSGHDKDTVMADNHPELPQVFLSKPYLMSTLKDALTKAMS